MNIFILSPHIDDAAFSLSLFIARTLKAGAEVSIINCFTVSNFTINASRQPVDRVSDMRKQEDIAFNALFKNVIHIINFDLNDAPLRNNYIRYPGSFTNLDFEAMHKIVHIITEKMNGILLCPIGIGRHIDHMLCRQVAIKLYKEKRILFYEDLPYAAVEEVAQFPVFIEELAQATADRLSSIVITLSGCEFNKEQAISVYKSQINDSIIDKIALYTTCLNGERLWGNQKTLDLIADYVA